MKLSGEVVQAQGVFQNEWGKVLAPRGDPRF